MSDNTELNYAQTNHRGVTVTPWGILPVLSIAIAGGLWLTTLSHFASRNSLAWAMPVFWVGILLMFLPTFVCLWQTGIPRNETIATLILLGLGLYLVSALRSPLYFSGFDVLLHLRTANDILDTHRLFTQNTLLPISPLFPGLELATAAVASLSGLDVYISGMIVVGMARVLMVLALYLILERLSGSVRTAGLGTLIYMGSSTFVFFDGDFSYESLGLPLAFFVLYLLLKSNGTASRTSGIWNGLAVLAVFAVVITHHLTAYILTAFLILWSLIATFMNWRGARQPNPILVTLLLLCWNLVWLFTKAQSTIDYLAPYIQSVFVSFASLIAGQGGNRQLLTVVSGSSVDYERIVAFISVAVILLFLGLGLWQWWRAHRQHSLAIALALSALAYPALPLLRLNTFSWEASNRLAGPLFVAIAFIIALGMAELKLPKGWNAIRNGLAIPGVALIFVGGIIAGSSPSTRLPGPYIVSADSRSVDPQGVLTAELARQKLGLNNRMVSDRVQAVLMGSYGAQRMVVRDTDGVDISGIFLRWILDRDAQDVISQGRIRYVVVDRRVTTGLPLFGYYYESWEQLVFPFVPPVNIAALDKFDHSSKVSRLVDSGDIVIYDLGGLIHAP
ncbi:MAG TPA: hypothetical protein VF932_00295 [Anaerolineae bacterium]